MATPHFFALNYQTNRVLVPDNFWRGSEVANPPFWGVKGLKLVDFFYFPLQGTYRPQIYRVYVTFPGDLKSEKKIPQNGKKGGKSNFPKVVLET